MAPRASASKLPMNKRALVIGGSAYGCLTSVLGVSGAAGGNGSQLAWIVLGIVSAVVLMRALASAPAPKSREPGNSAPVRVPEAAPVVQEDEPCKEAFDFASFIGDGKCSPSAIYDVSVLPHPKERIEHEIMLLVAASAKLGQADYAMRWHLMLDHLAQFQSGVGEKPVGTGAFLEEIGDGLRSLDGKLELTKELARRYLDAPVPDALTQAVEADQARYREFMHAALGAKWDQEMAAAGKMAHELLDQLRVPR